MDKQRKILTHLLATLADRTENALRGTDDHFPNFSVENGGRTPTELIRQVSSTLGYTRTFFMGCIYEAVPLPTFGAEVERLYSLIYDLHLHLAAKSPVYRTTLIELIQGPIVEALANVGQLEMLSQVSRSRSACEDIALVDIFLSSD